ncbi:uncharacterized protein LOC133378868 [Rhineura floridana]|uniref:uncharacterized protein LOC133378868 n=1 Tax=Rhineura floridana TaxID=261503 RepID=UPI002AC7EC7E|nr:uncharacterized protein LOC133378868 [Rhineura floridana]
MADLRGPVQDLNEEATCPICLEYFRDPVIIPECGHNFCRACLSQCWEKSEAEASCPQCRERIPHRNLIRNRPLANVVEILIAKKKLGLQEEIEGKGRICEKHQEPLKLFCKDDEAPICVVCDKSKEHKGHEVISLEEASQEYKDQICSCLDNLRKEREKILALKVSIEKESQDLLKRIESEREKTVAEFRRLHQLLEEQEKLLLDQMEEVEKEVARKREEHLARLSEKLSSLESVIQEMEEKRQQPASELLQDIRSFLQRSQAKENLEDPPVAFPPALKWKIWDFCDINPFLEGVIKQFRDTLGSGLQLQKGSSKLHLGHYILPTFLGSEKLQRGPISKPVLHDTEEEPLPSAPPPYRQPTDEETPTSPPSNPSTPEVTTPSSPTAPQETVTTPHFENLPNCSQCQIGSGQRYIHEIHTSAASTPQEKTLKEERLRVLDEAVEAATRRREDVREHRSGNSYLQAPMRQVLDGTGHLAYVYVPFTTSDLINWKNQTPPLREDPGKAYHLWQSIFACYHPSWAHIQTLMNFLLTPEEKSLVIGQARRQAEADRVAAGRFAAAVTITMPEEDPNWDAAPSKSPELKNYRRLILLGLQNAIPKPTNMSKLYEIRQGKDEDPSSFLVRLQETMRKYTPLDPAAANNQRLLVTLFIEQSAQDIRRKLQKVEGAVGINLSQLMDIAYKVFVNRDEKEKKEDQRMFKWQCAVMAAVMQKDGDRGKGEGGRGQRPIRRLERDQCAKCLKKGHWAKDCEGEERKKPTPPPLSAYAEGDSDLCEEATCPICLEYFRDPVIISECGHKFCRACLSRSKEHTGHKVIPPGEASQEYQRDCVSANFPSQGSKQSPPRLNFPGKKRPVADEKERKRNSFCLPGGAAMADLWGPVQDLCEEATCSICLEYFWDPVIIPECGHNFCRACLRRCWGKSEAEASCPQCRERVQRSSIRPNRQLADIAEIARKLSLQRGKGAERKGRVCEKHQEPLKLFCKDDEAPICVVCDRSKEHKGHEVIPLEEASQEYQEQISISLESLRKEREKILAFEADTEKESQDLLERTESEREKMVAEFRRLHQFLEEQEKFLLTQMEEAEEEIARKRDKHLARLSKELSSLENIIQEMEDKRQQPASELLQDIGSFLQRSQAKENFENLPVAFPPTLKWRIWDFCDINPFLKGVMKQFRDALGAGLQLQKENITLDPATAHPRLYVSEDLNSVTWGGKCLTLRNNAEKIDVYVLGYYGFTAGRHFWEVTVESVEIWAVGVAIKGLSSCEGIWHMGKWVRGYRANCSRISLPVSLREEPKRIRVALNCEGGRVAFYDADRAALLYTFQATSFSRETLWPWFCVINEGRLALLA